MQMLIAETHLDEQFHDHKLKGEWSGYRECHVEPDWVLIYKVVGEEIVFTRTGTHSDLLGD
jgi:mRNA interferase YafQ